MLTQRIETPTRFTRRDVPRLAIAAGILILALAAILGADILPRAAAPGRRGPARDARHRRAARARLREHGPDRRRARGGQCRGPAPVRLHDRERDRHRGRPAGRLREPGRAGSTRRSRPTSARRAASRCSRRRSRTCPTEPRPRWPGSMPRGWAAVRTEAARVLDATLRTELRDTEVAETRTRLAGRMAGGLDEAERMLAAELIGPLVVAELVVQRGTDRRRPGPRPPRRSSRSRSRSARARSSSATARR